jgi:hypothetical protein
LHFFNNPYGVEREREGEREREREMNTDTISSQIQSLSSSACLLAAIHSLLPNRKEEILPQAAATI